MKSPVPSSLASPCWQPARGDSEKVAGREQHSPSVGVGYGHSAPPEPHGTAGCPAARLQRQQLQSSQPVAISTSQKLQPGRDRAPARPSQKANWCCPLYKPWGQEGAAVPLAPQGRQLRWESKRGARKGQSTSSGGSEGARGGEQSSCPGLRDVNRPRQESFGTFCDGNSRSGE